MTQSVKDLVTKAYNPSSIPPNPLCSLISTGASVMYIPICIHMRAYKIRRYNKNMFKFFLTF